jgi:hypothetical protein
LEGRIVRLNEREQQEEQKPQAAQELGKGARRDPLVHIIEREKSRRRPVGEVEDTVNMLTQCCSIGRIDSGWLEEAAVEEEEDEGGVEMQAVPDPEAALLGRQRVCVRVRRGCLAVCLGWGRDRRFQRCRRGGAHVEAEGEDAAEDGGEDVGGGDADEVGEGGDAVVAEQAQFDEGKELERGSRLVSRLKMRDVDEEGEGAADGAGWINGGSRSASVSGCRCREGREIRRRTEAIGG